jgi:hypothetical protein
MELITADVVKFRLVRRPAKECRKVLDGADVIVLGLRGKCQIVMSSIMRRRNGLMAWSVMGGSFLEVREQQNRFNATVVPDRG